MPLRTFDRLQAEYFERLRQLESATSDEEREEIIGKIDKIVREWKQTPGRAHCEASQ
jgi:CHASE3 domain sensor protein